MRSMPFLMKEGYFTILSMVKSVRLRKANLWKPDGCKDMNFYLKAFGRKIKFQNRIFLSKNI